MYAILVIISFILADNKINAAFQFLSCEVFLKSSSIFGSVKVYKQILIDVRY